MLVHWVADPDDPWIISDGIVCRVHKYNLVVLVCRVLSKSKTNPSLIYHHISNTISYTYKHSNVEKGLISYLIEPVGVDDPKATKFATSKFLTTDLLLRWNLS